MNNPYCYLQNIAEQQNAIWRKALANVDLHTTTTAQPQPMASSFGVVRVPYLRLPEENIFINACGLNAIKITLGVHMPIQTIPWISTIGQAVDIDGNWQDGLESGDIPRMRDFLANTLTSYNPSIPHHYAVGSSNYAYDTIWEAVGFRQKVINSVDRGHAMIFGLWTNPGFPDWQWVAPHIVPAYGYVWNAGHTNSRIYWADGNNTKSGHKTTTGSLGAYYNSMATKTLWDDYAEDNDFQIYQY